MASGAIICPRRDWSRVVRGNCTPTLEKADCTRPEQSNPLDPVPPHWYGLPMRARAQTRGAKRCGSARWRTLNVKKES